MTKEEKELQKKKELWSQVTITEVDEQRKTEPDVYWSEDLENVYININ